MAAFQSPRLTWRQCAEIHRDAQEAGKLAAQDCQDDTVLQRRVWPFVDDSPVVTTVAPRSRFTFAWVDVVSSHNPASATFARWAKRNLRAEVDAWQHDVVRFYVGEIGESLPRKYARAYAYARVLRDHGICAFPDAKSTGGRPTW